jgi:methionyl-tRNA synthetase
MELITADVIARYQQSLGNDVFFNTGTDEHGQKIWQAAIDAGVEPQAFVDKFAPQFQALVPMLHISEQIHFIRTTEERHVMAAQELWRRCQKDIYKRAYTTLYCVGCELEKQLSELVDGRCPLHPNKPLEERDEENYFFAFSRYQQQLLDLYQRPASQGGSFVHPATKQHEILSFVSAGLQDFSISRLKSKMPWGVTVPDDPEHVMYVWFDALTSYISTLDWPNDEAAFSQFWPGMQIAGKDNLRQQSAMWQAMLLSAGLPPSQAILINGFISVNGQKMSKSLGNVIAPAEMLERYGVEATRFLLLQLGPIGSDMDVSWEWFDTQFTAVLANNLGNTCSRVAKLCNMSTVPLPPASDETQKQITKTTATVSEHLHNFRVAEGLGTLLGPDGLAVKIETMLSSEQPWKAPEPQRAQTLANAVAMLRAFGTLSTPFLPKTGAQIAAHFAEGQTKIESMKPLFPRLAPTTQA